MCDYLIIVCSSPHNSKPIEAVGISVLGLPYPAPVPSSVPGTLQFLGNYILSGKKEWMNEWMSLGSNVICLSSIHSKDIYWLASCQVPEILSWSQSNLGSGQLNRQFQDSVYGSVTQGSEHRVITKHLGRCDKTHLN